MTYATIEQLKDRYSERMLIELTDRGEVARLAIDTDIVDRVLEDTDAVIDGYLAARYALPLVDVPPLIRDLAQTIAIYKLHAFGAPDHVAEDHRLALRTLQDIAKGAVRIPAAGAEPSSSGGSGARMTDRERPLTADNLKGFI